MSVPDLFFPAFRPSVFLRSLSSFLKPGLDAIQVDLAAAVAEVARLEVLVLLSEANDFKVRELGVENAKLRRSNSALAVRNTSLAMRLKEFSFSPYDPALIESVPMLPVDAADLFL